MSGADYIESLELMGMQFGLDRMLALMEALGHPEQRFDAIHIVGSNGKSSTVRFCEALLEAEGVATGAYTSPHITTFRERIRIGGETISAEGYERAVSAVRDTGIEVTQFEALTAAAYVAFAEAGVQVAVVEAGLGGRLDATNVLARSRVQVLTNVSLEHSELLGQTRERIAAEKLAVVPEGGDLVIGEVGWEDAAPQAARTKVVTVGGSYQDQNRAVARAAVETLLGRPVDPSPIERLEVAGRLEVRAPPSARDLGRCPQPGRHAAAGRGAARAARRPPGGGRVRGDGRQGRFVDGLAAADGVPDHHRHHLQQPAVASGRHRGVAGRRTFLRTAEGGARGCAGAGRAERRRRGVRIAVPAARSQR